MLLAFIASLALPVAAVLGVLAYIRRTRLLQDSMRDGSPQAVVLDSLDQVHVRLDAMNDRLKRLEEGLRLENAIPQQVRDTEGTRKALPPDDSGVRAAQNGGSPRSSE